MKGEKEEELLKSYTVLDSDESKKFNADIKKSIKDQLSKQNIDPTIRCSTIDSVCLLININISKKNSKVQSKNEEEMIKQAHRNAIKRNVEEYVEVMPKILSRKEMTY